MDLSILTLDTLRAVKVEALEVLTWENVSQRSLDAAEAVIKAVDAECEERAQWVSDVRAALAATA
jgi:hypothetical protein